MLWLYERKFVSLLRQIKATATASEQTKAFVLQSNGASSPTGLRQTKSSGSAFRVNKNQSYRGRLTTRTSPILLTRQLGTVVRRKTDNPNQRSTIVTSLLYLRSKIEQLTDNYRRTNGEIQILLALWSFVSLSYHVFVLCSLSTSLMNFFVLNFRLIVFFVLFHNIPITIKTGSCTQGATAFPCPSSNL